MQRQQLRALMDGLCNGLEKLQTMLGMKVFHVPNQWADFVVYVRAKN